MMVTARRIFSGDGTPMDPAIEARFFSRLKMRNGTFKLTRPNRFADIEQAFAPFIASRATRLRSVLDVGASTGVTTIELADFLARRGVAPEIIGTDLYIEAHLVKILPGVHVLCDPDGWPLQYDVAGVPLRAWIRRLDYVTLAALPLHAARAGMSPALRRFIAEGRSRAVRMQTRALSGRRIELVENDIFTSTASFIRRFDFIRAANILNLGYFSEHELSRALDNIRSYCSGPGAMLLVTRGGERGGNDGTLFELREKGCFAVLSRIGRGSEVEDLVLSLPQNQYFEKQV